MNIMRKRHEMNQESYITKKDLEPVPIKRDSMTIVDRVEPAQSFANDAHEIEGLLFGLFESTPDSGQQKDDANNTTSTTAASALPIVSALPQQLMLQDDFIDSDFWTTNDHFIDSDFWATDDDQDDDDGESAAESQSSEPNLPASDTATSSTNSFAKSSRTHHPENWMKRYKELAEYKRTYGHCVVDSKNYDALARWVKRQRHQYKKKQEGGHSTLIDARQQLLEDIGFIWNTRDASWKRRFNELLEFKKQYGHTNVPGIYPPNRALGIWVKSQRKQYLDDVDDTFVNRSQATILRASRYRCLESIGFQWILRSGKYACAYANKVAESKSK